MEQQIKPVLLIIADISGYTRFMVSTKMDLAHGQIIISELIKEIIRQIEIPLEVSKLEGDAVFLYAPKSENEAEWADVKKNIGGKLVTFFEAFSRKVVELSESNLCNCPCCDNVNKLRLKLIVHFGEALFYQIGRFYELSGVDVIIVHRLLKNSVNSHQYILMTEPAYREVVLPGVSDIIRGEEHCEGVGQVKTCVYIPPDEEEYYEDIKAKHNYSTMYFKLKNEVLKIIKTILILTGIARPVELKNISAAEEPA